MSDPFEILHDELVRVAAHPHPVMPRQRSRAALIRARSRRWLRRPLVLAIVLVGASASAGGLALAGTFNGSISPQAWVDGQRVQPEASMTPDQTAELGILRRPRVASDALSQAQVSNYTDSPDAAFGPNPSLSRRAEGFNAGAAWLIPGNGNICFEAHYPVAGGGGTCGTDANINAGRVAIFGFSQSAPGLLGLAGVVPDGVSTVTVTPVDGPPQTLTVYENVYMTEIALGGFTASFTGPNGPVTIDNDFPALSRNTGTTPTN